MKFSDIPQLPFASYRINVPWNSLIETLENWSSERKLAKVDLDPDFQRAHVWTEEQQIAYVEYMLRGGFSGQDIFFNCPGWMSDFRGPFVLVDGKQRITAVLRFLNNEIMAYGYYYREYEGKIPWSVGFVFHVNNLKTRKEVLKWYLGMNSGGTVHTKDELNKVRDLLEKEEGR